MDNSDYQSVSFQIYPNLASDIKFQLTCKDNFFGFDGKADLFIKNAPSFLTTTLANENEKILICQNITFNRGTFYTDIFEKKFIQLISKAMAELYKFSMFHQLQGVLISLSHTEIDSLTELQKNWLRDFCDLFSYVELSPKGFHQLYMPTLPNDFQNYCTLNSLLEQSINSFK